MINWFKYRFIYFGLSLILIAIGGVSLITPGLKFGLDFTGGSFLEIKANASLEQLQPLI